MRVLCKWIILSLLIIHPAVLHAENLEDDFMRGVFRYLAKNRNMNLIAYSGQKVAEIGKLYYIEEPDDADQLNKWSRSGAQLKLFLLEEGYDLSEYVETQKEEDYVVDEKYSDYLGLELKALLQDKGVDINAFKKALRRAEIRFSVYRIVVPAGVASDIVQRDKHSLIRRFNSTGLGVGMIMPFQQLVIADFKYNEASSGELEAFIGAEVLKTIKAKLSAGLVRSQNVSVELPSSSTIAIKPFPLYFKETNWWGRYFK